MAQLLAQLRQLPLEVIKREKKHGKFKKKNANEVFLMRDSLFRISSLSGLLCFPGQRLLAELQWRDGNTKRDFTN